MRRSLVLVKLQAIVLQLYKGETEVRTFFL